MKYIAIQLIVDIVSIVMEQIVQHIADYDKMIFGAINKYWAKAVKLIRAKEFLAELLGTFILVVSIKI